MQNLPPIQAQCCWLPPEKCTPRPSSSTALSSVFLMLREQAEAACYSLAAGAERYVRGDRPPLPQSGSVAGPPGWRHKQSHNPNKLTGFFISPQPLNPVSSWCHVTGRQKINKGEFNPLVFGKQMFPSENKVCDSMLRQMFTLATLVRLLKKINSR